MAKKTSGAAAIRKAGGGKRAIKTWRSLAPEARKSIKSTLGDTGGNVMGYVKTLRRSRKSAGLNPTSGKAPTLAPVSSGLSRRGVKKRVARITAKTGMSRKAARPIARKRARAYNRGDT